MRILTRFAIVVFCVAPLGAGVRTVSRDGTVNSIAELPSGNQLKVIVEFRDPPMYAANRIRTMSDSTAAVSALRAAASRATQFESDLRKLHGTPARMEPRVTHSFWRVFSGASAVIDPADLERIRKLSYVASVHADLVVHASLEESVQKINAGKVWATFGTRGSGIVVAIVDTGIDYNHAAFGGGLGPGHRVAGGFDFVNNDADPMDDDGHGTHVAGIVGANGDGLTGVAPEVTFLAYKVLDSSGKGDESAVIAGIEHAVDPNGDGNPADHADIVNLSLGQPGTPDDPVSRAVETANAAGVLVCAAAGNSGSFYSVASPANAPSAIAVGATDQFDHVTSFSSLGPVDASGAIKPDVVAPGLAIESAELGGGTIALSGTSMAAPHVAGIAALLKSLHRSWTPAQLKAAIVETAVAHGAEIMAEGNGRVDAFQAASTDLIALPSTLSLGHDDLEQPVWTATQTLTVTNMSSAPRVLTAKVGGAQTGVDVTITPASFALNAGESATLTLSVTVDNATSYQPASGSLALGGRVEIDGGAVPIRIPWAFVKSAEIVFNYDRNEGFDAIVSNTSSGVTRTQSSPGVRSATVNVPPGDYDVVVIPYAAQDDRAWHLIVFEHQQAIDRLTLDLRQDLALNEIAIDAADEQGQSLNQNDRCWNLFSLQLPDSSGVFFVHLQIPAFWHYFISNFSSRMKLLPFHTCATATAIYSAQFQPLDGVSSSVANKVGAADWVRVPIEVTVPPGARNASIVLVSAQFDALPSNQMFGGSAYTGSIAGTTMHATAFLLPQLDPRFGNGAQVSILFEPADPWTGSTFFGYPVALASPLIRIHDGAVALWPSVTKGPATYTTRANTTLRFGRGIVHPETTSLLNGTSTVVTNLVGNLDESRDLSAGPAAVALYDGSGKVLASGTGSLPPVPLAPGVYRFELATTVNLFDDVSADARVTATYDVRRSDGVPPSMTSLHVLDANGVAADRLAAGEHGVLQFSAIDRVLADGLPVVASIDSGKTQLVWRAHGTVAPWTPLPTALIGSEIANGAPAIDALGHQPAGQVFRTELESVSRAVIGAVDLKFHFEDPSGNALEYTLSPAFLVDPPPPRRRAFGH